MGVGKSVPGAYILILVTEENCCWLNQVADYRILGKLLHLDFARYEVTTSHYERLS